MEAVGEVVDNNRPVQIRQLHRPLGLPAPQLVSLAAQGLEEAVLRQHLREQGLPAPQPLHHLLRPVQLGLQQGVEILPVLLLEVRLDLPEGQTHVPQGGNQRQPVQLGEGVVAVAVLPHQGGPEQVQLVVVL